MIESAPIAEPRANGEVSRTTFLGSHRAMAVLSREFARLSKELVTAAKDHASRNGFAEPEIRQAPDRCIIQLGPVAMTATWLRNGSDTPDAGELMVIVWDGVIAPRGTQHPERLGLRKATATPVSFWEESYVVSAENEASWHWHPRNKTEVGYESGELAVRCIEQLGRAHAIQMPAGESESPSFDDRTIFP